MSEIPTPPLYMRRSGVDPLPELGALRDGEGIKRVSSQFGGDTWLVTRYADVRTVLLDAERFSNASGIDFLPPGLELSEEQAATLRAGNLLAFDPPDHTRLRRILAPEFTFRRMLRLEPRVTRIVEEHLDAMESAGSPADLVSSFALPIPSLVICELLGVPYEDRDDFQRRSNKMLDAGAPFEERIAAQLESRAYLGELVARAKVEPGEELLGMLVREHGDELTDDELVGVGNLLLLAGHETTSNMLGLGTLALLRHPDQLELLRKEPERIDATVEELLRWLSIVHCGTSKTTTTEVEIAGQTIGPGELVTCALPVANRDPEFIADPERLDITRGVPGHLAFGHGIHHCLGAPLARMEMRIAFPALLSRFPELRMTEPDLHFRPFSIVHGLTCLPVAW
ncbi:cytochrome P450 [Streptosporangium amethystogenes]|uniref:cytochrome P450 n=1 Tax=Streptosporangium amethystogenes TaxID=2002 RepID=UPI0037AA99A7